ncbi:hypothetical protein EVAR_62437_1 [Eumeta japonica]|uniref:Uncharacterized protein n=1 Tax=Eumeta variegata TaxID=151549 RepID=A0A4C1Z8G5_EUMVA|nr:hypothetical protein EVAR_62437_1 [Eumeta japonica]
MRVPVAHSLFHDSTFRITPSSFPSISFLLPPSDILFLFKKIVDALVIHLRLRVSMCGINHLLIFFLVAYTLVCPLICFKNTGEVRFGPRVVYGFIVARHSVRRHIPLRFRDSDSRQALRIPSSRNFQIHHRPSLPSVTAEERTAGSIQSKIYI